MPTAVFCSLTWIPRSDRRSPRKFRLAVQRRRGRGGEDRRAVYVDVVAFGDLAGSIVEYLAKGRQVAVSGRLEHDQWEAEDGSRRQQDSDPGGWPPPLRHENSAPHPAAAAIYRTAT